MEAAQASPAVDLRARKRRRAVLGVLLAPVIGHLAATLTSVALFREARRMDMMDCVVHGFFAAYLAMALAIWWRRPKVAPKFALLVCAGVVAVLLAEIMLHVAVPAWPPYHVPWPKMARVAEAAGTMRGITGEIRFTTNSIGVRGPEVGDLAQYDHRILCVGGSTTECVYVTDEASWPWAMQIELEKRTGRKVYVGNAGRSGQYAANHAYMLNNYHFAPRFEYVVVLAGINDMGNMLHDRYEESLARVPSNTLVHPSGFASKPLYYRSSQVGIRLAQLRWKFFPPRGSVAQDPGGRWADEVRAERRKVIKEHGMATDVPADLPKWLDRYDDQLMGIIKATRDNKQKLLLMTQPTMWREDLPPDLSDLLWVSTPELAYSPGALATMMDAYNARMLEVARREGVPCIDLAKMIPKDDTALYDDCHFNTAGSLKVAAIVADWFEKELKG